MALEPQLFFAPDLSEDCFGQGRLFFVNVGQALAGNTAAAAANKLLYLHSKSGKQSLSSFLKDTDNEMIVV